MMSLSDVFRAVVLVGSIAGSAVLATLHSFNHFDRLSPSTDTDACLPVTGVAGPEDLEVDTAHGRVFVSSFDRRDPVGARGAIHLFDIADPLASGGWRDRTEGAPDAFAPLGLSVWSDGEATRLFVVNAATSAVELFDVAPSGDLAHLETFRERRLTNPSSVVATGARSFYVSNNAGADQDSAIGKLQFVLRAGAGGLLHYDGVSWREAANGLRFANGLAMSEDGKTLFAAETAGMALKTYDRDPATGVLTYRETVRLPGAADNLKIASDGSLLVAVNPKPLSLIAHQRDPSRPSPSLVLRYAPEAPEGDRMTPLFSSDGSALSAATGADIAGETLFIGSLYEDRFLMCPLGR